MDPHLIYTISEAKKNKVVWSRVTADSEWMYIFIANNEINQELILNNVNNHFCDDLLFVVSTRKLSRQINKKNIDKDFLKFLVSENILVWNVNFTKAIKFNNIGTMRSGQLKSEN